MMFYILLFIWFAFWSAQAGRSMVSVSPKLDNWQDKKKWYSKIPEIVIASSFGSLGTWGVYEITGHFNFNLSLSWLPIIWILLTLISLGGKESGTHAYLNHTGATKDKNKDGVVDNKDLRNSTTSGWNKWLASRFGFQYGDEGFSWVWAFTKGAITTLPIGCIGAITQPIGREIASHIKKIGLPFERNFWMEFFGDGFGYSSAATIFIFLITYYV